VSYLKDTVTANATPQPATMSQRAVPFPPGDPAHQRHFYRYPVAVPVDVVVLRSGTPRAIPGRTLDAGEGGLGLVLAGELQLAETVRVAFMLPTGKEPVQAKAVVRHYGPIRCGLQFLAMAPEQQTVLHSWLSMTAKATGHSAKAAAATAGVAPQRSASYQPGRAIQAGRVRIHLNGRNVLLAALGLVFATVALASWWHNGWNDLERNTATASASTARPLAYVPGIVMEQRVLHKVDPVYPPEAERIKLQGVVVLQAVIGADGMVKEVHPISGSPVLGRSASDAVRWWRFQPYQLDNQPVPVQTTIEVEFRLN
jgi:TonB family protein